jgi:hypothetical protein
VCRGLLDIVDLYSAWRRLAVATSTALDQESRVISTVALVTYHDV